MDDCNWWSHTKICGQELWRISEVGHLIILKLDSGCSLRGSIFIKSPEIPARLALVLARLILECDKHTLEYFCYRLGPRFSVRKSARSPRSRNEAA